MFSRTPMVLAALVSAGTLAFAGTAVAQDRDCVDFSSQQEAQNAFEGRAGDPERLDADNDNIACEELAAGTESAPADEATGSGEASGGSDQDSGTAPTGGVEAGNGGTADRGDSALPAGLGGLALLIAGGALALQRRQNRTD